MLNPDFRDMLSVLCAEKVEFLLVGAYALAAHGLPRATGDMDIWIRPSAANVTRVWRVLEIFGAPLERLCPEDLIGPATVLQIGIPPRRIDILTSIEGVDFDSAWDGRIEIELEGLRLPVLGRRQLIKNKKALARPQDLADLSRLEELE